METPKSTSQFLLNSPSDWRVWVSRIRTYASGTGIDVWHHIDPEDTNLETLTKPVKPSPNDVKLGARLEELDY